MVVRSRYRRRNGEREAYRALVESYRTERGPRQRIVAYLGLMDEAGGLGMHEETYILCRRRDRREKEQAMHARFEKRIEEGLARMAASCRKRAQEVGVIERRIGRLLGQNIRTAGLFEVQIAPDNQGAAQVTWKKVESWRTWAQLSEGAYVLRSNVSGWNDEDLWRAYIQLTEAETAFRIQKSDLSLRPVWHQNENRVRAHILVCFLAYVLWKFLGQLCQRAGLGDESRRVLAELSELRAVDVGFPRATVTRSAPAT